MQDRNCIDWNAMLAKLDCEVNKFLCSQMYSESGLCSVVATWGNLSRAVFRGHGEDTGSTIERLFARRFVELVFAQNDLSLVRKALHRVLFIAKLNGMIDNVYASTQSREKACIEWLSQYAGAVLCKISDRKLREYLFGADREVGLDEMLATLRRHLERILGSTALTYIENWRWRHRFDRAQSLFDGSLRWNAVSGWEWEMTSSLTTSFDMAILMMFLETAYDALYSKMLSDMPSTCTRILLVNTLGLEETVHLLCSCRRPDVFLDAKDANIWDCLVHRSYAQALEEWCIRMIAAELGLWSDDLVRTVVPWLWHEWVDHHSSSIVGFVKGVARCLFDNEVDYPVIDGLQPRLSIPSEVEREYAIRCGSSAVRLDHAVIVMICAAWLATQYLLRQRGITKLTVYRALFLSRDRVRGFALNGNRLRSMVPFRDRPVLSDVVAAQQGMLSSTVNVAVANRWRVGRDVESPQRVVLRIRVPAHRVISLPIYGNNFYGEQEVVIATTSWLDWDMWCTRAKPATREDVAFFPPVVCNGPIGNLEG